MTFLDRDLEIVRTAEVGDPTFDLAWSPDGTRLASGGEEGEVSVVDVATGGLVHPPTKLFGAAVVDVEWLPGSQVVASGTEGTAAIYDVARDVVRAGGLPASDTERRLRLPDARADRRAGRPRRSAPGEPLPARPGGLARRGLPDRGAGPHAGRVASVRAQRPVRRHVQRPRRRVSDAGS